MNILFLFTFIALNQAESSTWFIDGECGISKYADAGYYMIPTPRIVGGRIARPHAFPWMISFIHTFDNSQMCGGSIINENWILTAAHCFETKNNWRIQAIAGEHRKSETGTPQRQIRQIELVIKHENYSNFDNRNDIALVKVRQPFIINEFVRPICAPDSVKDYTHNKVIIAGWGSSSPGGEFSDFLRFTTLNITSLSYCKSKFLDEKIFDEMICATDNRGSVERDSCQMDSGGPLFKKEENNCFHIVGISSWGFGCANKYPGIYTKVAYFNNWISANIKN